MPESVEVYRLRVSRGNHSSSGGAVFLYESRKEFEAAVYTVLLEELTNTKEGSPERRRARSWLEKVEREGESVGLNEWTTQKVVAAEKLIDGQWVDLGARLISPRVEFDNDDVSTDGLADGA